MTLAFEERKGFIAKSADKDTRLNSCLLDGGFG